MLFRHLISGSLAILIVCLTWLTTPQAEPAASEPPACATSECHTDLLRTTANLPKGHGDCSHCHKSAGKSDEHPKSGAKTFAVAREVCLECHPIVVDYDYLHPPVAAGDCLACHKFHASTASLLIDNPERHYCYNCHQPVVKEGDTVLHGDVAKQKCTACHTAHGSFFKHLLAGPYSNEFFNDYDEKQYALCFQCHKIDLLLHPNTSYNTNFRDGTKNLHFVHVNRTNRGRACKLCHEVHAGHKPKLMADTVAFGDWEMPVNFVINDNGGQCTPGCHAQKSYDRSRKPPISLPNKSASDGPMAERGQSFPKGRKEKGVDKSKLTPQSVP